VTRGWLRPWLALEGLGVFFLGLAAAWYQVPALQDSRQAIYDDLMTQAMGPDRHGLGRMLRAGFFPSWTRYQFTGEPYAANTQHETLYPGSLPFLLTRTSTAMDLVIGLHLAVAFLGMWAYLRLALRASPWAAVFGGLSWGLSSQILGHITLGDQLHVLVWTPWVFLGVHLALERAKLRHVVFAAVAIGLQFLAGHPEEWIYSLGSAVLYGAFWACGEGFGRRLPRRLLHAAVQVGGSVVLFAVLFAWQLFPTLLLKGQGFRGSGDFSQQYPLPRDRGVNALLPDYGRVLLGENLGYASVVALGLFALYLAAGRGRVWLRAFLAVSAALGYVMALGLTSRLPYFYRFFYDHVSLIHQFRVPSRWLLLTCFAFVVGGSLGVDTLLERTSLAARLRGGALAAGVLAGVFAFAFAFATTNSDGRSYLGWALPGAAGLAVWALAAVPQVPRAVLGIALIVIAGFETHLARPGAEYKQKAPNQLYDDYGPIAAAVAGGGRYLTIAQGPLPDTTQRASIPVPPGLPSQRAADYYLAGEPPKLAVRPNNHIAVGAEALNGRDNGLAPLGRYKDFWDAATGITGDLGSSIVTTPPSQYRWAALDLLALDDVVTNQLLAPSDVDALTAHGFRVVQQAAYVELWRRPAQPLVRIVHDVDVIPDRAPRLARLADPAYPLLTRAVVERPVDLEPARGGAADTVAATRVEPTRVGTTVTLASRGLLVLADPYYPQWQVTVDGRRADILPVDSAFRGVVVPPGTHRVEFRYVDTRLRAGLAAAGLTLVALVAVAALLRSRTRRRAAGRQAAGD